MRGWGQSVPIFPLMQQGVETQLSPTCDMWRAGPIGPLSTTPSAPDDAAHLPCAAVLPQLLHFRAPAGKCILGGGESLDGEGERCLGREESGCSREESLAGAEGRILLGQKGEPSWAKGRVSGAEESIARAIW